MGNRAHCNSYQNIRFAFGTSKKYLTTSLLAFIALFATLTLTVAPVWATINVAPAYGVASASSTYTAATAPQFAIDGNASTTGWNAGRFASSWDPAWLIVDLQRTFEVSTIVLQDIRWTSGSPYFGYTNIYNLYVSTNGTAWTAVGSGTLVESNDPAAYTNIITPPASASTFRYVKYEVVGGSHWAHLQDLEIIALQGAQLSSITVTPANPAINIGQTQQFTATGTFSDGTIWPLTGAFNTTGSLVTNRHVHAAALLEDGRVLLVGGETASGWTATAELYTPDTGTFNATGSMTTSRFLPTATLLKNGKVLVAGGQISVNNVTPTAELYDPATGTFSVTGSMNTPRYGQTATLLDSGKVLVTGGWTGSGLTATAELYDPVTGTFSATGSATASLYHRTATLLGNGKVLVAGGYTLSGAGVSTTDIYDPVTGTFSATGNMITNRYVGSATLLENGKVLIVGGNTGTAGIANAELYDPATGTFSATGSMAVSRYLHAATILGNGKVLVAGGYSSSGLIATAELYDPTTGTFSATGSMAVARSHHIAIPLQNGKVLVAGGNSTSELYTFGAEWLSSNTSVATINSNGLVTALSSGITTITATSGSISGNTTLTVLSPTSTLTISKAGLGSGTVTSIPAGISCGADCTEIYNNGTSVTLTASPVTGSVFAGWTGGGCSGTGTCTVTINADTAVLATFNVQTFTLTATRAGTGSGTVTSSPPGINCGSDCAESYNTGTVVNLAAAAVSGSIFTGWSGDSDCADGVVSMTASKTCTATFDLVTLVSIAVARANPTINVGETQHFTATGTFSDGTSRALTSGGVSGFNFDKLVLGSEMRHSHGVGYDEARRRLWSSDYELGQIWAFDGVLEAPANSVLNPVVQFTPDLNGDLQDMDYSNELHLLYLCTGGAGMVITYNDDGVEVDRFNPGIGYCRGIAAHDDLVWVNDDSGTVRQFRRLGAGNYQFIRQFQMAGCASVPTTAYDPTSGLLWVNAWYNAGFCALNPDTGALVSGPFPGGPEPVGHSLAWGGGFLIEGTESAHPDGFRIWRINTLSGGVAWSSGNASVGTIDANGLATGVSPGITTITATLDGVSGSTTLTVRDTTPPIVIVPSDMIVEATGPSGSVVTFTASASDLVDGILTPTCTPASGSTFVIGITIVTCTATDAADNIGSASFSVTVRDTTPPVISISQAPLANANGWNNTDMTVSFSASDAVSTPNCTVNSVTLTTDGAGQVVSTTCTDAAGNGATTSHTVNLDKTAPVVIGTRTPAANGYGWNNTNVTAHFTATDGLSGIQGAASLDVVVSTEGAGQMVSYSFTDLAGNSSSATVSNINIDKTAPVLTLPSLAGSYGLNSSLTLTFAATDALSQIATQFATLNGNPVSNGSTVVLTQLGANTFELTATDKAGNSVTETRQFTVNYTFGGFLSPLGNNRTTFHLGSVIPVKFDLYDANGVAISSAVARLSLQQLSNGEPVGDPIDATPTSGADSGNLFRYSGGHYMYNLSTKPFTAGIWRIQATLDDGTVRTIEIGLTSK